MANKIDYKVVKEKMRHKARTDLFYLCRDVLGYKDLTDNFHKWLCREVENKDIRKRLFLLPRGHFKTTVVTIAHSIQLVINNPDIRILIASSTLKNAQEMLRSIKQHFFGKTNYTPKLKCSVFKWLFPEFCPLSEDWGNQDACTLGNRKNWTLKEGTFEVMGSEGKITGRHYDYLKKDDLVTPETVTTLEQIEKTITWDQYSISLFDNPGTGRCDYVGTRYHYNDLYGHLLDQNKETNGMKVILRRAIEDDGKILFPERFDSRTLDSIKHSQGSYIWNCQYMNEPTDDETAVFKKSYIKYWTELPKGLRFTMTVDPATEVGEDFAAIVVVGCDIWNNWYVVHAQRYRCTEGELIRQCVEVYKKWRPVRVGFEINGFQRIIKRGLEAECTKQNIKIPILPLTSNRLKSKEERIKGLAVYFENGTVYINKSMVNLEDELLRFPRARRRDLADALTMQLEVSTKRSYDPTVKEIAPIAPDLQAQITGYY